MFNHVDRNHLRAKLWGKTYLHKRGRDEINEYQGKNYSGGKKTTKRKQPIEENANADAHIVAANYGRFKWAVLPCFVKCSMENVPLEPFEAHGVAQPGDSPPPIGGSTIGFATAIEPGNTLATYSCENSLQAGSVASSSTSGQQAAASQMLPKMIQQIHAFVELFDNAQLYHK